MELMSVLCSLAVTSEKRSLWHGLPGKGILDAQPVSLTLPFKQHVQLKVKHYRKKFD